MNLNIYRGRPTKDPEARYNQEDDSVTAAWWTMAVNRERKHDNEPDADFIPMVAFGRTAGIIEKYVHKGSHILVTGRLQNNNYEKDGQTIYGFQVVVSNVELLDKKVNTDGQPMPGNGDGFMNIPDGIDEGLPFR